MALTRKEVINAARDKAAELIAARDRDAAVKRICDDNGITGRAARLTVRQMYGICGDEEAVNLQLQDHMEFNPQKFEEWAER